MAENAGVSESAMSSEMQNGVEKPELGIPEASSPAEATERSRDLYSAVKTEDLESVVENSEEIRAEEENGKSESKVIEGNDRDLRNAGVESEIEEVVEVRNEELESASEGGKVYTMRELLDELKEKKGVKIESDEQKEEESTDIREREVSNEIERNALQSQESRQQQLTSQNDVAIDLITSVSATDEEGRSRQRILTFAAKRYAASLERNPRDYDALYNWALVLQESADNVGPNVTSPSKDSLLEEACKKYEEATRLCPTLHDAFYNWAIAISDRARIRGRTKEAEELWKQATDNYEKAVQLNWNSPQALNNWGLALQELSAIVPAKEKQSIVRTAISKFRAAIRLQFDFHRAIYNLGTVLYGLAEDTLRTGRQVSTKEAPPNDLYSQSAIYIAAAHALKPTYSVYRSALRLVRSMLPLPYLKVGYLFAPPAVNTVAPHGDWKRSQFVLNHEGLQQVKLFEEERRSPSSKFLSSSNTEKPLIKVDLSDIVLVSACTDLTLPPGAGFCIGTDEGPLFLVADSLESMDGWLDAIRLVYTIYARGKSDVLAAVITG